MKIELFERVKLQFGMSDDPVAFENVTDEFIKNYCYSVIEFISKENGIKFEDVFNKAHYGLFDFVNITKRTEIFLNWLANKGVKCFSEITSSLILENLSDKVFAFAKLYNHNLQKAISNNNIEMLLDNLYLIPGKMVQEYKQFGFLRNTFKAEMLICNQVVSANNSKIECKINGRSGKQVSCFT